MAIIHDDEFGKITIRRSSRATQVRLRVGPDGLLRASLPMYAPTFLVKKLIKSSRSELRELLKDSAPDIHYQDGMRIGKSHALHVRMGTPLRVRRQGQGIEVTLPPQHTLRDPEVVTAIRDVVQVALRIEAKSYLPRRLAHLAQTYGYSYEKVRFSHASSRWGSCSAEATISLNIALMKLPFELIDYVLIHELAHTKHMNHSPEFWQEVARGDPQYKAHRAALKHETPSL